jgi:peptidyl-prolyl cis-trans isomerase C
MSSLKRIAGAACATLMLFSIPACSDANAQKKGEPVAKVNGTVITKPEVDRAVQVLLAQNKVSQKLTPEQMQKVADQALIQLASAELLYQEAKKLEVKELDKLVAEKYAQNKAKFPSEAEYQKSLQQMGMSAQEVEESMRKEILVNNYVEKQFFAKATVSEADIKKFYDENVEKVFKKGERLKASHILVGVEQNAPAQDKQKAKEKAEALLKRLQSGEEFAAVAKKDSTCPSSARGGELGVFGKGQISPMFDKAAFAMKAGEQSAVVETEMGYHIIKVHERIAPSTDKLEEVREKIAQFLKMNQTRQAVAAFVEELRKKAKIEKV